MDRRQFMAAAVGAFAPVASAHGQTNQSAAPSAAALSIGISYQRFDALYLKNTVADAKLVDARLRALGVSNLSLQIDPDPTAMVSALQSFAAQSARASCAILYIAAHGVQMDGANYVLGADGQTLIDFVSMLELLRNRQRPLVAFLDTCRNNPFRPENDAGATRRAPARAIALTRSTRDSALSGYRVAQVQRDGRMRDGMARFDMTGSGVKIVFATDPNNVAYDAATGASVNGPFALALDQKLSSKLSLDDMITEVTRTVRDATGGKQTPWQQGALERPIFLAGRPPRLGDGTRDIIPLP